MVKKPTLEAYQRLAELSAQRYGYHFNYKDRLSKMMKETNPQMQAVRAVSTAIKKAIASWLKEGKDTRNQVISLQQEIKEAREVLSNAQAPYREKINVLRRCVAHLDKVIPNHLATELGHIVKPLEPDKAILKAIEA